MNWTCEVKMKMDKESRYSVLMSVYGRERPEYLRAALKSIMGQTLAADEIVLVCDGPLGAELEGVIAEFKEQLQLLRLSENAGLGSALAQGLSCAEMNGWPAWTATILRQLGGAVCRWPFCRTIPR